MSTRHLDPPVRSGWVWCLPAHKAATAMLKEYLQSRVGCQDKKESSTIKSFLRAYNAATSGGNPAEIEIAVTKAPGAAELLIFCNIHGVRPIGWLPSLIVPSSDRLKHIVRETGASRIHAVEPDREPTADVYGDGPTRRFIPLKVETRLIPGRRPT